MSEHWVTSDTHFGHKQILTWRDGSGVLQRGSHFSSVEEMNEALVQNWNACVGKSDTVWHLGDVFFGKVEGFLPYWRRLNGRKMLVLGNHDDVKLLLQHNVFDEIVLFKRMYKLGLILSHVPLRDENCYGLHNVHGHLHYLPSPTAQHTCVSVEQTNYAPANLRLLSEQLQANGKISL